MKEVFLLSTVRRVGDFYLQYYLRKAALWILRMHNIETKLVLGTCP